MQSCETGLLSGTNVAKCEQRNPSLPDGRARHYVDVPTPELAGFEEDDAPVLPASVPHRHQPRRGGPRRAPATTLTRPSEQPDCRESGFNPNAVSRKGARVNAANARTAAWLGVPNALESRSNVEGGTPICVNCWCTITTTLPKSWRPTSWT